jgi:predicted dehydrogenase
MMALRVGIISANWGTMAHLPAWRSLPGVVVTSVCTSRQATAEAACGKHGIQRAFWDAAAMVSDPEIDIIDCGTRPSVRHAMVLKGLQHGKHVYNAIPFAADLEAARVLHGAWQDSGRIAIVDAYSEWLPAHRLAKEIIDDGYLGQPFGGTCIFNMSLFNRPHPQFPYNWFAQGGLGVSAVRNLGSHTLHMLIHLFGPVAEVVAHDAQLLPEWRFADGQVIKSETNDFANMMLRFVNGMVFQVQISWNAPLGRGWHLEAFGSKGRLVAAAPSFPTSLQTTLHAGTLDGGALEQITIPERFLRSPEVGIDAAVPMPPAFPMALAMSAMVSAIEGRGQARPDFAQAWMVERVLEAVRRSSAERRWVGINEIV